MNSVFLQALHMSNACGTPPVWLMRQAGRYMPSYQKLRSLHSLWELFHNPELAAHITRLPIQEFHFDAAILFSDILLTAELVGLSVEFPDTGGPKIVPPLQGIDEIRKLPRLPAEEVLNYLAQTIQQLRPTLRVPLIGFCGGPCTLASYFLKHRPAKTPLTHLHQWIEREPDTLHILLEKITQAAADCLALQIEMGVDAVQIFDSWAGLLPPAQFQEFVLPYLGTLVRTVQLKQVPVILFARGSGRYVTELSSLYPTAISFDAERPIRQLREETPSSIAVQGNLAPETLLLPPHELKVAVRNMLDSMQNEPGYICNLGHGVLPNTPYDHVRCFLDTVREHAN